MARVHLAQLLFLCSLGVSNGCDVLVGRLGIVSQSVAHPEGSVMYHKSFSFAILGVYSVLSWVGGLIASKVILAQSPAPIQPSVWEKLVAQVPSLCVLVFIVIYFLKHSAEMRREERKDREDMRTQFIASQEAQTSQIVDVTNEAKEAIKDSIRVISKWDTD